MRISDKDSRFEDLQIDSIEYMFIEWLVRRGIYTAYKSNYERAFSLRTGFRERLRGHIRRTLRDSSYDPSHLISSAFLFASTPEGFKFWDKQSTAWRRFCTNFRLKF